MKIRMFTLLLIVALTIQSIFAAFNGLQPIGFSKYLDGDVNQIADIYVRVGGDLSIGFLPYQFNPTNPYGKIDMFVKRVLPNLHGRLKITLFPYNKEAYSACGDSGNFDDTAFNGGTNAFRTFYLNNKITPMDEWVTSIWKWALARGLQSKLSFRIAPILEDQERTANFTNIFGAINYRQVNTDQVPVNIEEFRSPNGDNIQRVGNYRLELHGRYSDVKNLLQPNDIYSNDGTIVTDSQFASDQRAALVRGIDVAWWIPEFNNKAQNANPCQRSFNLSNQMGRIENMLRAR
jgi:hypothetical protein